MTSLTGASGEDFASILRSLGYRLDRRPKPPEAKPAEAAAPQTDVSVDPAATGMAPTADVAAVEIVPQFASESVPESAPVSAPTVSSLDLLPVSDFVPAVPQAQPEQQLTAQPTIQADNSSASANTEAVSVKAADEPVFIDVWRPAGRSEKRPPRARRPQRQAPAPAAAVNGGDATPATAAQVVAPATAEKSGDFRPKRQDRQERHERQQRVERQSKGLGQRGDRQPGGLPRGDRPPRRDKGDRVERAEREQYYAKPHGSNSGGSDRNQAPDPKSPFAKLAALKQQLEQNNKP